MLFEPPPEKQNRIIASGFSTAIAIAAALPALLMIHPQCANARSDKFDLQTQPQTAIFLRQSSLLSRHVEMTITKRVFKLEFAHPHCVLIADSAHPDSILMYSPESKLFFREPPSQMHLLDMSLDTRMLFKKVATTSKCTVAGVPAIKYTSFPNTIVEDETYIGTLSSTPTIGEKAEKPKTYTITRADYFATTAFDVPTQAIKTMSSLVRAPHLDGLPLGLIVTKSNGKRASVFYTQSISYIHVDKKDFLCPPSYKLARTDMECLFGSAKVGQLEDMFKDMAVGKDFGTQPKPRP